MRRNALPAFLLIFVLLTSLFSSTAIGYGSITADDDQALNIIDKDPWWKHWARDKNHNGIDDLIDDKIAANSNERVPVYLKYGHEIKPTDAEKVTKFDLELGYVFEFINTISARNVDLKDIPKLRQLPGVGMIELQILIEPHLDVSNPATKARNSTEYSPNTAWALGFTGKGVNIAIIDRGVDDNHESLLGRFVAGVSFGVPSSPQDGSFNPDDEMGHGTYCAGIALGTGGFTDLNLDGEPDYMGVAPSAGLIDVQWGQGVVGVSDPIVKSFQWIIEQKDTDWPDQPDEYDGIDVISISMDLEGTPGEAAAEAVNEGLVVVTSGGNDGPNNPPPSVTAWPDKVIVVGAINDFETTSRDDDVIASFSSRGPREDGALKPDVSAPGELITAPSHNSFRGYGFPRGTQASGTSFAAPHVAGVVALMLEVDPNLTPDEVMEILHETAEARGEPYDPGLSEKYNTAYGWGIIDAYEAVVKVQEYDDRPPIISDWNVEVSGITATITWLTHKDANSIVKYGKSESQLDEEESDLTNYTREHSITIKKYEDIDLEENTTYYFKITCYDKYGHGPSESPILNFTTEILPDTTPPEIVNVVNATSDITATIFWDTNELSDSLIEYGLTTDYGQIKSDSKPMKRHTITIFNLEPTTTYHFRINSSDVSGNYNQSEDKEFTTDASPDETPPVISNLRVTDITDTTVIILWETNEFSNMVVKYSEDKNKDTNLWNKLSDLNHYWIKQSIKITGLNPFTIYYYQIESTDPSGNTEITGNGNTKFNTTGPPDNTPPRIIDGPKVTILTDKTATIEWTTDEESEGTVEYGSNYGSGEPKDPSGEYVLVHNITLTGLTHSSTYHYRVRSKDKSPNANENFSDDYNFITKPPADKKPPRILAGPRLLEVGEHTATIIWTTNEESDSELHYGTTPNYGSNASDDSLVIEHWIILTGLTPSTKYHYKVVSSDASGNTYESDDDTFTTLDIPIPIEIEFFNFVDGKRVSGVITLDGSVSGGTGSVEWVKYKVDNETWQNLGSGSTFSIVLDTRKLSEGEHSLYVQAKVGDLTMQEDITFIVEHPQDNDEANWLMALLLIAAIGITIAAVLAISRSSSKKKAARTTSDFMPPPTTSPEEPFSIPAFPPADTDVLKFLPDEQPLTFQEAEAGISFIPETTILSEEPEMSFVPDREPISFNISEEEAPDFSVFDTVRCPKCKRMFNADITLGIVCPECGFSASIKK
ncbi:MAG: S8 family serine peptidase [Thermoplasmata archaeon]